MSNNGKFDTLVEEQNTMAMPIQNYTDLLKLPGKVRGVVFQTDVGYLTSTFGADSIYKLQQRANQYNISIPYGVANATTWYPVGLRAISLLLIQQEFKLEYAEIRKIGENAPKISSLVKFSIKFFVDLKKFTKKLPEFWEQHFSVGSLQTTIVDEQNKHVVVELRNFELHPLYSLYLEGYIESMFRFIIPTVVGHQTKSIYNNDPYDEYTFTW